MPNFTLKVLEIRKETSDTVTVIFKQPGLKKIKYAAGQYLTLIFRINNRRYQRPYSFSSAPIVDATLNVTVKRVPGGVVSNHIADFLKVDDVVEVMEPMGDFTLNDKSITADSHLVLWGAGSGVTPLISIAKYALQQQTAAHVTLVYGNRDQENIIFNDEINTLQKTFGDTFFTWHFHTKAVIDAARTAIIEGRIAPEKIIAVLKAEGRLGKTFHYICGPAGLKESVSKTLRDEGVPQSRIFSEEFNLVINPEKFEGVITQLVTINNGNHSHLVEVSKGKTILEAALDALVDLPYSCQTGNCLVCKGTLLSGSLRSLTENIDQQELQPNEHLLCCSVPLTDDITISVQ